MDTCHNRLVVAVVALAFTIVAFTSQAQTAQDAELQLNDKNCRNGNLEACNAAGLWFDRSGNAMEAIARFRKACEGGVQVACSNLAEFYFDGRGVEQNYSRAFDLFLGACNAQVMSGCAGACIIVMGSRDQSEVEAASCQKGIKQSCDNGNSWMCDHARRNAAAISNPRNNIGCRSGASALANAYVLGNPMYSMFLGDLKTYITNNSAHFVQDGDAIRCARVMAAALTNAAVQTYDPEALRSRDELNARLGSMGISPGAPVLSASASFYFMGQQISRLAAVMPAAASGGPLRSHLSQEHAFAAQLLAVLLEDPMVRAAFAQAEPLIRESAEAEYRLLMSIAAGIPD